MKKKSNPSPPDSAAQLRKYKTVVVNEKQLANAFTEWERRYREEPELFASEAEVLAESPETYGDACAPYLLKIIREQRQQV